ncbi:MAG: DUF1254 domain-containing protein [Sphingomonadales bacterium]|nr:MAG: DUF1254 domain-containing protein [Sphingomonadales bacterium]
MTVSAEQQLSQPQIVTADNFTRAETDTYFAGFVRDGAFGRLKHNRTLVDVDHQTVVRPNRDTIYSLGLFDLDAGAVTITLPDAGGRFMSLMTVDEDHYNPVPTIYDPGAHRFTREQIGTRYVFFIVRTFVNPNDPADLAAVANLQDRIAVDQASAGSFDAPAWDQASLVQVRNALKALHGAPTVDAFGPRGAVDPIHHLIATATGWGGNPAVDAQYASGTPERNDGTTVYRLTVKDVPVDAFWSLSVYNEEGFFEKNPQDAYSLNNITATPDADGSFTIQFGGCGDGVRNCLPIMPGWNYAVRMYRPSAAIVDGSWQFPKAQPV